MRRLAIVLIPLLLCPLLALSLLTGWLAQQAQDQLLISLRQRQTVMAGQCERDLAINLDALAARVKTWGQEALRRTPEPMKDTAWSLAVDHSGVWHRPTSRPASEPADAPPSIDNNLAGEAELADAARNEQNEATLSLAIERYESISAGTTMPPVTRARALLGLGRCYQRAGKPLQAIQQYQRLVTEHAATMDETGLNFGAEAAATLARSASRAGGEQAVNAWRNYTDALIGERFVMSWILELGHLTEALALAPVNLNDRRDIDRRGTLSRKANRLKQMSDAIVAVTQNPSNHWITLRPDLLMYWTALQSSDAYVIATWPLDHIRSEYLTPLLDAMNSDPANLIGIRGGNGTTVAGRTIASEAVTAQLTLVRWGLPWTLEAGFGNLPALQRQNRQRHALLIGSVVLLVGIMAVGCALAWKMVRREMELSRLKSDFVDNVSHELRTPVTSIKMFSELLQTGQTQDPARQQEYYRLLTSESSRLSRMIENMLNFSRIMAGSLQLRRQRVDVTAYLAELRDQLEIQARSTGHRIHLNMSNDLPICSLDSDAMSRAVANLVSNATKYSPKEAPVVLTAQLRDGMLSLTVRDRGIGIAEQDLPRVFDRFYRGTNPDGEHIQGTGLGLTIVKDTVERHGGTVRIESRPGQGTAVEMLIPIA